MAPPLRPARRQLALVASAALFLSACNGGSTASEDPEELQFSSSETAATTSEPTSTGAATMSDNERVEAYCALAIELDSAESDIDFEQDFGPENAERIAKVWQEFIAESEKVVPDEIADDYDTAKVGVEALIDALAETDYNYFAAFAVMDPALLENDEIDDANDRLDQFAADVCGITGDDDDSGEALATDGESMSDDTLSDSEIDLIAGLLETEIGRQLFIEGMMQDSTLTQEQATCFVDTADLETLLSFSNGTSAENAALVGLFETLSECDIDIDAFSS